MQILTIQWKWNIPNALSLLRLLLVPCFAVLYLLRMDAWAFSVLLVSGISDVLDGFIARRFGQITECGKLMDPLADKLTQITVVICLTTRYTEILPLTIICFVKELCQAIGGIILLRGHRGEMRPAKWFGKVSTVVFYTCMLAIVLWYDILEAHSWALILLVVISGAAMLSAFIGYLRIFLRLHRGGEPAAGETSREADQP